MKPLVSIVSFVVACFFFACDSMKPLSPSEKAKLDPQLLMLLQSENIVESDYSISTRADGATQYAVIIRGSNPEELRAAGIALQAVIGDVMTARVTKEELRKILTLPSVRAVENSSKDFPNNP